MSALTRKMSDDLYFVMTVPALVLGVTCALFWAITTVAVLLFDQIFNGWPWWFVLGVTCAWLVGAFGIFSRDMRESHWYAPLLTLLCSFNVGVFLGGCAETFFGLHGLGANPVLFLIAVISTLLIAVSANPRGFALLSFCLTAPVFAVLSLFMSMGPTGLEGIIGGGFVLACIFMPEVAWSVVCVLMAGLFGVTAGSALGSWMTLRR